MSDLGVIHGTGSALDGAVLRATDFRGNSLADGHDYFKLLKPRVMSLVVFTGFVGMIMAPGHIHPFLGFTALLCIAVGAGASGALNMWYDADIDAMMSRTITRPIPSGHVSPNEALAFGIVLSVASVTVLALAVNWLSAGLLAFTIFFYAVIYTMWLKRWTSQNIVIGGAAGALPPVIGWAAVTNGTAIEPWVLFAIIFVWTPPHFWALALNKVEEYRRAKVPMLPVVSGSQNTRTQILAYTILLLAVSAAPVVIGMASWLYAGLATILGLGFLWLAIELQRFGPETAKPAKPMKVFAFSILYLFAVFAALPIERLIGLAPLVGG